jgi:methyl-accepting chemotaxis protein
MFRNLSIKAKLLLVAVVATVGAVTLAGFNYYSGRANSLALENVYKANVHSLVQLQKMDGLLLEVRFRVAGVLLDVMPVQGSLNHLRETRKELDAIWRAVQAAPPGAGEEQTLLGEMAKGWGNVQATLGKIEQAYVAKDNAQLTAVLEEDWALVHTTFIKPLQNLLPLKEISAKATYEDSTAISETLSGISIGLAILFTTLIVGVVGWVTRFLTGSLREAVTLANTVASGDLSRDIVVESRDEMGKMLHALAAMQDSLRKVVGRVRRSADEISMASRQIAQGNSDLSQRTEEQASSLEETASSMEELTSTVKQNAENAQQANHLGIAAGEVAVKGGEVMVQVVGTMSSINEASKKIADIIGVIDGIAFQTNILALNAAVEAARAGEQGRGFAVVAAEVRNLAQRSAAAAKDIKELINDSVAKVDKGTMLVDQAGKTTKDVVASIKLVTDILSEITAASQEQSQGIEQVNQAITQMEGVTQQNAALVEEAAAAAESMVDQTRQLDLAMSVFRIADTAEGAEDSTTHAPEHAGIVTPDRAVSRRSGPAGLPSQRTGAGILLQKAARPRIGGRDA